MQITIIVQINFKKTFNFYITCIHNKCVRAQASFNPINTDYKNWSKIKSANS